MDSDALTAFIEAALLTTSGPVTATAITEAVDSADVSEQEIIDILSGLAGAWNDPSHGLRLERVAGGWRFVTEPSLDPYLRVFHGIRARQKLSQAALEVLAIVAHRQPVTLPEINFIRGANSAAVVRTLLDRKLIRMAGRKKVVGKPFLYRTTKDFLLHFGLERAEDLPDPEEFIAEDSAPSD